MSDAFHRGRSGPGGWWILSEPELHFGPDALVPDLEKVRAAPFEAIELDLGALWIPDPTTG